MIFSKLTDDLSIISKLGDNPGADDGLTAEGLKSKFDEAALILQAYLNGTLVETLNKLFAGGPSAPNSGLNMTGPINMNNNTLQNVRDPQSDHEAMNLAFANGAYVPQSRKINKKPLSSDISLSAKDVGARGDTWLPTPAEIGAVSTGAFNQHAENKENPHGVTAAQVGATTMTLLWENASPNSAFAGQTINLDLSGYDHALIEFCLNPIAWQIKISAWYRVDAGESIVSVADGNPYTYLRGVTVNTNNVTFGTGRLGNTENNNNLVPLRIYGLKGVTK